MNSTSDDEDEGIHGQVPEEANNTVEGGFGMGIDGASGKADGNLDAPRPSHELGFRYRQGHRDLWPMWAADGDESDQESDSAELPYPCLEDSDDESDNGAIDWDTIESGCGLSSWDQLGESYEREAASVSEYKEFIVLFTFGLTYTDSGSSCCL